MSIPLFWLERTGEVELELRRSSIINDGGRCPLGGWHSRRSVPITRRPGSYDTDRHVLNSIDWTEFSDSSAWPLTCDCGYVFSDDDSRFVDQHEIVVDAHGVEHVRSGYGSELPHGAVFEAWWLAGTNWVGPDGMAIIVMVPEHHPWQPDSQASNCTRKCPWRDDDARQRHREHEQHHSDQCDPRFENHKCWVRVGDPRHPETLHVSKDGETCDAGAGSILTPEWHGFLRYGVLAP